MAQSFLARINGRIQQLFGTDVSAGASNAGDLVALGDDGRLDESLMPVGIGANMVVATASEEIVAGRFINIYSNAGTLSMRLADNSNGRPAWGYVRATVAASTEGSAYRLNTINAHLTGLTPGDDYWLGTAGNVIDTPLDPETETGVDQYLGMASSATELVTVEHAPVYL